MIVEVSIAIGLSGCERTRKFEIDNSDLEGMTEEEKTDYIEELATEVKDEMVDWSWKILDDDTTERASR